MFEELKLSIAAAEQIISHMSVEKSRCKDSIDYWEKQMHDALENGLDEATIEYYSSQCTQDRFELEYITKIENLLIKEIKSITI